LGDALGDDEENEDEDGEEFERLSLGESEVGAIYQDSASERTSRSSSGSSNGSAAFDAGAVGAGAVGAGAAVAPDAVRPIDTGMHAKPKVAAPPPDALTWSQAVFSSWLYEHSSNGAGDELLGIVKDPRFKPEELLNTARYCKKSIEKQMMAAQPLFKIRRHRLKFAGCETVPPRRRWAKAEVVTRTLLSCVITSITNPRVRRVGMGRYVCVYSYAPFRLSSTHLCRFSTGIKCFTILLRLCRQAVLASHSLQQPFSVAVLLPSPGAKPWATRRTSLCPTR
jgi:hypothetical protein